MSVDLTADRELAEMTAASIRSHRDELAATVVETMYRDPFWEARFGLRGRAHSLQDAGYHLDHLISVLHLGIPDELQFYYRWLQDLLIPRGMCTRHLVETIDAMNGALAGVLTEPQAVLTARYLRVGAEALVQDHPFAQRIAEVEDQIIATAKSAVQTQATPPGKKLGHLENRPELRYYLSYLVDAIAAGRPDQFSTNASWVASVHSKTATGGEVSPMGLEAIGTAAAQAAPEYREQVKDCVGRALQAIDQTRAGTPDC